MSSATDNTAIFQEWTDPSLGAERSSGFARWKSYAIQKLASRNTGIVILIVILTAYISWHQTHFLTLDNVRVLSLQGATLGIPAIGMTLLMVAGYVDLSIGSVMSLIAVFSSQIANHFGVAWAVLFAVCLGGLIGVVNGALVWRISISPLIITLGGLTLYQGIVNVATQGQTVTDSDTSFATLGQGSLLWGLANPVLIFGVLAIGASLFLSRTSGGLNVFAVGGNKESAETVGINVRRLVIRVFAFNGILIGLAAVLTASRFSGATPQIGVGLELDVITAVILGGVSFSGGEGSIWGTTLAVTLLTIVNSGIVALGIDPYYSDVVKGALLLAAVTIDQLTDEQRERYRRMLAMRAAFTESDIEAE